MSFVALIQDDFMKNSTQKIFTTKSWALDFNLKTNEYGFLIYTAIMPNQDRIKIPLFYMFCSNDMK